MKVSVVICTYEPDFELFYRQLESILTQRFNDWVELDVIISDDSINKIKTHFVIDKILTEFHARIKVIEGPKLGSAAHNFLSVLQVEDLGEWVFLCDQDDLWCDNKVLRYFDVIEELDASKPCSIFSDASLIDENKNEISNSFFSYQGISLSTLKGDNILFKNCIQGATLCINKKMVELLQKSLEGQCIQRIVMHDWWLAILSRYCGNIIFIDEPLLMYRQHSNNVVGAQKKRLFNFSLLKRPAAIINKIRNIRSQYQLWLKVSPKLGCGNDPVGVKLENLSFRSKILFFMFYLIP